MTRELSNSQKTARRLFRQGRFHEAAAAFRQIADAAKDDYSACFNLGCSLLNCGDLSAAKTVLRRAIDLDNSKFEAWYNLGACLLNMGELDEA